MKNNYLFLLLLLVMVACSDEDPITMPPDMPEEMDPLLSEQIIGTFLMEKLEVFCDGEILTFVGDELGCVIEEGDFICYGMEFLMDGTLSISTDCDVFTGQYTVDDETGIVSVCDQLGGECVDVNVDDSMRFVFILDQEECQTHITLVKSETDLEDFECPVVIQKIKTVLIDNQPVAEYEYYDNGDIMKIDQYSFVSGDLVWTTMYKHESDKIISERTNLLSGSMSTLEYILSTGSVARRNEYNEANELTSYAEYTFDDTSCSYVKIEYYSDDLLGHTNTYQYTDQNCSYNRTVMDGEEMFLNRIVVTFDDKKAHTTSSRLKFFRNENPHNIVSYQFFNEESSLVTSFSYEATYVYDEHDYPVYAERNYLDGSQRIYEYIYE